MSDNFAAAKDTSQRQSLSSLICARYSIKKMKKYEQSHKKLKMKEEEEKEVLIEKNIILGEEDVFLRVRFHTKNIVNGDGVVIGREAAPPPFFLFLILKREFHREKCDLILPHKEVKIDEEVVHCARPRDVGNKSEELSPMILTLIYDSE
ncbi:hypothetical protein G5I_04756 [Acromyrmex echinatior]|uniref:Uncharacterized protein n=1 Tax=Acromyrmex echinatior TaxID=103372 RepID=F4WGH7_ACREC|nr:hypothetical protein G5I_04756 [Acromyrmex echinatior]